MRGGSLAIVKFGGSFVERDFGKSERIPASLGRHVGGVPTGWIRRRVGGVPTRGLG